MALYLYSDPIDRLHQENLQFLKSQRFVAHKTPRSHQDFRLLQWRAEEAVSGLAERYGYRVSRTKPNSPFDLWIEGVRVEVKGSHWYEPGRYQAAMRNHQADVVVFDCVNGTDHLHFIPQEAIGHRRSLAVWSYDPADSSGQWRPFLEEFVYLEQAIRAARRTWQLPLF